MTNWHKLKRHLTTALDNPPPHTDKATIAQVLFLMATMEDEPVMDARGPCRGCGCKLLTDWEITSGICVSCILDEVDDSEREPAGEKEETK